MQKFCRLHTKHLWILAIVLCTSQAACGTKEDPLDLCSSLVTYTTGTPVTAKAVLDANCVACHPAVAGIALDTYNNALANADRVIARAVTLQTMPPGGPMTAAERNALALWQACGLQP